MCRLRTSLLCCFDLGCHTAGFLARGIATARWPGCLTRGVLWVADVPKCAAGSWWEQAHGCVMPPAMMQPHMAAAQACAAGPLSGAMHVRASSLAVLLHHAVDAANPVDPHNVVIACGGVL